MKQIFRYSLLICFMFFIHKSWAKDVERKKVIEKSYNVTDATLLNITNKFGFIKINSWTKSEFAISIEIIGKGRTEEKAQRILDQISVNITDNSTAVTFNTLVSKMSNKGSEGFEVNYTVHMPEVNPLKITNSFGDVSMGNRKNDLNLDVSYGSFTTGNVSGDTELELAFGSGNVGRIQEGDIKVKYSKINIESGDKIELSQGFSNIEIEKVEDLELEAKYGDVEIGTAGSIKAEAKYSGFEIEELTGRLQLYSSYVGNFKIGKVAQSFSLIDIRGKYGSYEIGVSEGLNANIDATFEYASLKVYTDEPIDFHYKVVENNKSVYRGKIGKGHEGKLIKIDSSYGGLRLK